MQRTWKEVQQYCTTWLIFAPSLSPLVAVALAPPELEVTIGVKGDGAHDHTACSGLSAGKQMGQSGYGGVESARVRVVVRESSCGRGGWDFVLGWEEDFG